MRTIMLINHVIEKLMNEHRLSNKSSVIFYEKNANNFVEI